jgi:hypothetical protein
MYIQNKVLGTVPGIHTQKSKEGVRETCNNLFPSKHIISIIIKWYVEPLLGGDHEQAIVQRPSLGSGP